MPKSFDFKGFEVMRTFSQQLKSLTQAFGSLFMPVLARVMPYLQAFVELLGEAVHWIAGLFGIEIMAVDFSGYESGAGAIEDVADSAAGATDALGSAAKAAKEMKNATLGIDELNVISPPSASSGGGGSGGSGGAGGGAGFDGLDIDSLWDESIFAGIENKVDSIKEKFKAWLPVIGTIAGALSALGMTALITSIGNAIAEAGLLSKVLGSIAILTIEAALVFTFADNYLESGNLMNVVGQALVTAAGGYLMFKAWGPAGAVLALGVSIAAQLLAINLSLADGTVELTSKDILLPSAQLDSGVEIGSYVGTGTAGSSNPTTLTFGFEPKMVVIAHSTAADFNPGNSDSNNWQIFIRGMTSATVKQASNNANNTTLNIAWEGKTLSFYHTYGTPWAGAQLNTSGATYLYIAI